jgi:SEC-C motif-containing protein
MPFHQGTLLPKTALELMRSRYSAYALTLVEYLNNTSVRKTSREDIESFCKSTAFIGLEIMEHIDGKEEAFVTFIARLTQGKDDVSFKEKSHFVKTANRWIYESGSISNP